MYNFWRKKSLRICMLFIILFYFNLVIIILIIIFFILIRRRIIIIMVVMIIERIIGYDVVLVFDIFVDRLIFDFMKRYVKDLVDKLSIDNNEYRVGVMRYSIYFVV